jgi:hypothetical protein
MNPLPVLWARSRWWFVREVGKLLVSGIGRVEVRFFVSFLGRGDAYWLAGPVASFLVRWYCLHHFLPNGAIRC